MVIVIYIDQYVITINRKEYIDILIIILIYLMLDFSGNLTYPFQYSIGEMA